METFFVELFFLDGSKNVPVFFDPYDLGQVNKQTKRKKKKKIDIYMYTQKADQLFSAYILLNHINYRKL